MCVRAHMNVFIYMYVHVRTIDVWCVCLCITCVHVHVNVFIYVYTFMYSITLYSNIDVRICCFSLAPPGICTYIPSMPLACTLIHYLLHTLV